MDYFFNINNGISERDESEKFINQYEQGENYDEEQDIASDTDNYNLQIPRMDSIERALPVPPRILMCNRKPKWHNNQGRMYRQKTTKHKRNAPDMKGRIMLKNKDYYLSGWICTGKCNASKYIRINVSDLDINLEGKKSYKKIGKGYLKHSTQTAPKQPHLRGELFVEKDCYSLSAWMNKEKEKVIINSRLIEIVDYSDVQNALEEWSSDTTK